MTWSKGGQGKGGQGYPGYGGWSYWRGAGSPAVKGQAPWKQDGKETRHAAPKKHAFPHYDMVPKQDPPKLQEISSSSNGDGYVSELQRAVNAARKAEAKIKKIHGEKRERQAQWQSYEAELRRCYSNEKQRFKNALSRLERDEVEALEEQTAARDNLRKVATGVPDTEQSPLMEADTRDFEMLIRGADKEMQLEEDNDAVIQRAMEDYHRRTTSAKHNALAETSAPVSTPVRKKLHLPSTPLSHPNVGGLIPMPSGPLVAHGGGLGVSPHGGAALTDPYQEQASSGQRPLHPGARHQSPGSTGRRTRESLGVRSSIKEATKGLPVTRPCHSPGLAEKLMARRQQIEEDAAKQNRNLQAQGMWMGPPVPLQGASQDASHMGRMASNAADSTHTCQPAGQVVPGEQRPSVHLLDDDFSDEDIPAEPPGDGGEKRDDLQIME